MYFKRIDLHGFKSFAEPVSIEFHNGITCIVGPNGSGKSNISDAIRWVLGEQSPKMLRGGKMEEVIFAGTESRKSRGMAEVTLTIDNTTGLLPIDYTEVAITRRMYRSGESEYSINGNSCRLKDIRELIMDTGIGVEGYSIIGQGKIADIVSNKPESRRQIFEEAAGIVKYRTKKAESERKLEASRVNLDRANDIINEIESRIDGLKEDSEKARIYLGLKDRYKELEINITLKNIENLELKNEYIKDDLTEIANHMEGINEEKLSIDETILENKTRNDELERLSNEARDRILAGVEEISTLNNRHQLIQEKLSAIDKDKVRLTEEISTIEDKLNKEKSDSEELHFKKRRLEEELKQSETELAEKIQKYTEITGTLSAAAEKIDQGKNKLFELHNFISSKNGEMNSLINLKETLLKRKDQILSEESDSDSEYDQLTCRQKEASEKLNTIQNQRADLEEQRQLKKKTYNEDITAEKQLSHQLEGLRVSLGQISTRKKMIEEMESSYEGYNNAVKFIMKSNLSGINGVVAELIEVPAGFETAIETALGASLQNIVCEDDRSAQAAISLLKTHKAGRLTFLPLNNIKGSNVPQQQDLKNAPGFIGFGVQCIRFDPKYKPVIEYLLGRVIIVDNLDHAVKLSKRATGGLRFVTLEGEVINSGGAITGGTHRNSTSNLLERKTEAKNLGLKQAAVEKDIQETVIQLERIRVRITELLAEIQKDEQLHREAELELLSINNDLNIINGQAADYHIKKERWKKELSSIAEEEKSSQSMIEALSNAVQNAQAEIKELEGLAEVGLLQYEKDKAQLSGMNEEITKARIAVSKAEGDKANADNMADRIGQHIRELEGDKETKIRTLSDLEEQKSTLYADGANIVEDLAEKEQNKTALENYLAELQEEKQAVVRYLNEISQKKDALDEQLKNDQNQKYELEIKKAKNETQLDTYKDKLWEEFEVSYLQAISFRKKDFVLSAAVKESRELKGQIKDLGEVNVGAIKEYESVKERYDFLTEQRADILHAVSALTQIISDMDKTIKTSFKECFEQISVNFEIAFKELFGGGTAELRLEDINNPLECGIEIVAQPPGKKLQNISLMSGGEKTMTAIALMFAVLKAKPTPFCILDEVEAALDDANIDRFAKYLMNFNEVQFALVTHQKATMEYADVLYGVTMPEQGISKIISLKLGDEFEI